MKSTQVPVHPKENSYSAEMDKQTLFKSPQISNLQILGLILLLQIRNCLGVAVRKSENFHF